MLKKRNRMVNVLCQVSGIVMLSKVFGFIKQMVVAGSFGATVETDLISLSEGLTANIEYVISQTMITAFIPVYIHAKARSTEERDRLVSNSLMIFPLAMVILSSLIAWFSPLLAKIIAPTYDTSLSARLAEYIRLFSPLLILYMAQSIFHALLNANECFVPGQLIGLNQSIILILLTLLIGNQFGVQTLAIGFFTYSVINVCYLGFVSRKHWLFRSSGFRLSDDLKTLVKMTGPLLLGYAVVFINQQVDKIIVSGMPSGTVTAMGYGATLSNFVTTMIGAVCSVIYTRISSRIADQDHTGATVVAEQSVCLLISIFLPVSMITVLCAQDIVSIVFGRGAFDARAVQSAAYALSGYGFLFIPYALKSVFSQLQYGCKDTKRPMVNNSIGIGCNIVFSLLLYQPLGVFGVTLSSSIAEMVSAILNYRSTRSQGMGIQLQGIRKLIPVWLLGGFLCAGTVLLSNEKNSGFGCLLRFVITAALAIVVYASVYIPYIYRFVRKKTQS